MVPVQRHKDEDWPQIRNGRVEVDDLPLSLQSYVDEEDGMRYLKVAEFRTNQVS